MTPQPTQCAQNAARALCLPPEWTEAAATIDRECLLPQKHAALLLAQTVCDIEETFVDSANALRFIDEIATAIDELRGALKAITTKP